MRAASNRGLFLDRNETDLTTRYRLAGCLLAWLAGDPRPTTRVRDTAAKRLTLEGPAATARVYRAKQTSPSNVVWPSSLLKTPVPVALSNRPVPPVIS